MKLERFTRLIVYLWRQDKLEDELAKYIKVEVLSSHKDYAIQLLFDTIFDDEKELFWDWFYQNVTKIENESEITEEFCSMIFNLLNKPFLPRYQEGFRIDFIEDPLAQEGVGKLFLHKNNMPKNN